MTSPIRRALFLLAVISAVSAYPAMRDSSLCTEIRQRVPWSNLAKEEKDSHIQADLCLINSPSKGDIPGAVTRWDDLQWPHVVQTDSVHIVTAPERLIKDERGYTGRMPYADPLSSKLSLGSCPGYWDDTADNGKMLESDMWSAEYFGGDGTGEGNCVETGPFTSLTLRWMSDPTLRPDDPGFYLHHSWLDKIWWEWQALDLPARLTDMGGPNTPGAGAFPGGGGGRGFPGFPGNGSFPGGNGSFPFPGGPGGGGKQSEISPIIGSASNYVRAIPWKWKRNGARIHRLYWRRPKHHNTEPRLFMAEIFPNITMAGVMDIGGDVISSEYLD
ncbi:hypothetical protein SUNI508_03168 [Seiridium unicorne]|uniref:Tyrosinase copper-binding domain-containing protein n=1 Tax=Seiridium unicorne TaxID=138068 RepID=A0ABR2VDP9_9PEZI